jgi:hypothetical protein
MSRASNAAGPRQDASARGGSKLGILRGFFVLPDFQGRKPFFARRANACAATVSLVLVAVAGLGVFSSSASATKYVSSFIGNPGSTGGLFSNPRGVAVHNGSGSLYVVDAGRNRIQQFDSSGGFVRAWGADVDTAGGTGFEVCVVAASCKSGVAGAEGGMLNLSTLGGVAVNQSSGAVYVTDANNLRVQQFTASGQFVRAWGQDVIVNTGTPANSNGTGLEICDTTTVPANVPADCKAGVAGSTGGALGAGFDGYPAVVPAGAPNAGNVVVADPGNRRVQEFTASGGFVRAFGADVQTPAGGTALEACTTIATCQAAATGGIDVGRFGQGEPKRVAADATGAIYAVESSFAGGNFRVQKFVPQPGAPGLGASVFAPAVLTDIGGGRSPIEIAIDPADGRVFVVKGNAPGVSTCPDGTPSVDAERRIYELSSAGVLLDTHLECAGFNLFRSIFGLAIDGDRLLFSSTFSGTAATTHRVYVADDDGITAGLSSVDAVTGITATSAEIAGTVNANSVDNSFAPTRWKLQVSTNGSDWSTVAASTAPHLPAGTTDVGVSASVDDLLPNTGYRVRVLTQKPFGNPEVSSPEVSFLTDAVKPDVAAVKADMVDQSSARLTGQVNPHSTETSYRFEWGQDSFDHVIPVPDGPVGSGPDARFVSEQLSGLQPGTTYQFRLVATSATEGATTSATKTFTTTAAPALAREFELVSPVDKVGGTGVGRFYAGPGSMSASGVAAWEGERFAAMGLFGSVLRDDGGFSFANDWALADRIDDQVGWRSHSPITHASQKAQHASFLQIAASSQDLSGFFWRSNSMPFFFDGFDEAWQGFDGGYLSDWGAPPAPTRWELFGPDDLTLVDVPRADVVKRLWDMKLSADGSTAVGLVGLGEDAPRLPLVHGLAGPGDPTARAFGDLESGRSIYLADVGGGLTDAFETGDRQLLNVCTGDAGTDRTVLPAVDGSGSLVALECPAAAVGRDARLVSSHGASLRVGGERPGAGSLAGTVSEDGSRVFFMAPDPAATGVPNGASSFCSGTGEATLCPPQLFVRQRTAHGEVVRWISRAEDGLFGSQDASLTGGVRFEGATPDGDKVFFRTNSPLTADDPNGTGAPVPGGVTSGSPSSVSWDLYMYDLPDDPSVDPTDGQLTRISAGPDGDGDCNSPLPSTPSGSDDGTIGALRAASRDGRRVYFTCTAPLPGVDAPADGTRLTTPGGTVSTTDQTNLYLYDANLPPAGERWRFITRLPRVLDTPAGTTGSVDACASAGTIPKSSFGSNNDDANTNFTGWRNANCVNATSDGGFVTFMTNGRLTVDDASSPSTGDIYGYDAESDELVRITASQGGVGGPEPCVTVRATPLCWGTGSPESMPEVDDGGRVNTALGVATDPLVAGERIAFFQSSSRLVPEDTDDGFDVYQWRNGELSLVSTGASATDGAMYKGNDRSGRNVYLVTRDRLSWQDTDVVADVYTARVGGGIDQPVLPASCGVLAGVCQPAGPVAAVVPPRASQQPGGGNATVGKRGRLSLGTLSLVQRRKAARSGVLTLRVRTSAAGVIRVGARAKIGRKTARVGSARKRVAEAGMARVVLRLSKPARKALRRGRVLRVALRVAQSGAPSRTATVRLPGASS